MRRLSLLAIGLVSCGPLNLITVPADAKGDVSIWFINDSRHDLCDLRMAAVSNPSSGYDWLSTAETDFPDGESRGVQVRPGAYKVQVASCDGTFKASADRIEIAAPTVISFGGHAGIPQATLQGKVSQPRPFY